jgi:hypothetical protein
VKRERGRKTHSKRGSIDYSPDILIGMGTRFTERRVYMRIPIERTILKCVLCNFTRTNTSITQSCLPKISNKRISKFAYTQFSNRVQFRQLQLPDRGILGCAHRANPMASYPRYPGRLKYLNLFSSPHIIILVNCFSYFKTNCMSQ